MSDFLREVRNIDTVSDDIIDSILENYIDDINNKPYVVPNIYLKSQRQMNFFNELNQLKRELEWEIWYSSIQIKLTKKIDYLEDEKIFKFLSCIFDAVKENSFSFDFNYFLAIQNLKKMSFYKKIKEKIIDES